MKKIVWQFGTRIGGRLTDLSLRRVSWIITMSKLSRTIAVIRADCILWLFMPWRSNARLVSDCYFLHVLWNYWMYLLGVISFVWVRSCCCIDIMSWPVDTMSSTVILSWLDVVGCWFVLTGCCLCISCCLCVCLCVATFLGAVVLSCVVVMGFFKFTAKYLSCFRYMTVRSSPEASLFFWVVTGADRWRYLPVSRKAVCVLV